MKLIENANQAYKMLSVQVATLGAVLSGVWLTMSDAQQAAIIDALGLPPSVLSLFGFAAVVAGRLVYQPGISPTGGGGGPKPDR